jgi:hypothetical protein
MRAAAIAGANSKLSFSPFRIVALAQVSTFAYTSCDCTQTWTVAVDKRLNLSTIAYTSPRCTQLWTFTAENDAKMTVFAYT